MANKYFAEHERYYSESEVINSKRIEAQTNKTEITLNSVHTIKPKSEESIILMR